ncbi:right-handed parallel beta-helix repeat-containing protein, partial [Neptuniibacter sp.]|uniref:right-handed parallel beta-helix repeat-containing protein n=1 Tax=Neptuniibacter sp. TaxID=1962643 RepID=UPI002615C270
VGHVTVEEGVTLTIDPGVEVQFNGYYYLRIYGILDAQGTAADMITFTSNQPSPAAGDWSGINLYGSNISTIRYAIVEYAYVGVNISSISGQNYTVEDCVIRNNWRGVSIQNPSGATIRNNTIEDNTEMGIYVGATSRGDSSPAIDSNLIQGNDIGISFNGGSASAVTNNTIINNTTYGLDLRISQYGFFHGTINNNSIYGNGDYNLHVYTNANTYLIDARNNWWGTTDVTSILSGIYDWLDDDDLARVDFLQFLDGPDGSPIQDSYVYGPINQDTTWTLADSPYIVVGHVTVEEGVTLTIDPGVEVQFNGYYYLRIYGILDAQGTAADMITFT